MLQTRILKALVLSYFVAALFLNLRVWQLQKELSVAKVNESIAIEYANSLNQYGEGVDEVHRLVKHSARKIEKTLNITGYDNKEINQELTKLYHISYFISSMNNK